MEKVFLLGDITLEQECETKQKGYGMLCLLDIKRKSIWDVSLAARVTSKEGKSHVALGRLTLGNQFTQWVVSVVGLEMARISFALSLSWSVSCFPSQQKHLQCVTKYSIHIQWLEEPHSQGS